jgi:uncharacterized membrane protein YraQ (UPF0718 family)
MEMKLFSSQSAEKSVLQKAGDWLLGTSQLVFAGVIVVSIMHAEMPKQYVVIGGLTYMFISLIFGLFFTAKSHKEA